MTAVSATSCLRLPTLVCGLLLLVPGCGSEPAETGSSEASARPPGWPAPRVQIVETEPLRIDRIYPSMTGPYDWVEVDVSELDWVTAFKSDVIDADSREAMGGEFFCHSGLTQPNFTRLMVTATGMEEVRFPPGFGMPVSQILSGLPPHERRLRMLGMVLNNYEKEIDRMARVRATIEYYKKEDLGSMPIKKLYHQGLTLEVQDLEEWNPEDGPPLQDDVSTHCSLVDGLVTHWVVPPGRQKTRKRYSNFLPGDGTVHYGLVHLHNHGVYMRITDVTAGKVLWQVEPVYEKERRQIVDIPAYSSEEGFRIYKDHEYELEAVYENTTGEGISAMAMIWLFYHPDGDLNIVYPHPPGERRL